MAAHPSPPPAASASKSNWPTPQDYHEALQNPRSAFSDPELQAGQPVLDALGLPRPITGQFASVYKLVCGQKTWAVRCFLRNVPGQRSRYQAIDAYLSKQHLPYFVDFDYQPQGIQVRGQKFPILKMAWVQGDSLAAYVGKHLDQPAALARLAQRWLEMMNALEEAGIAHGDLQHGNVLVVNDELRLVDYDGMFVPALAGQVSQELGHRHYQHPARRPADFDANIDHFSAWVIYLSLLALNTEPKLWGRFAGGDETLLFRKADFVQPDQSKLWLALSTLHNDTLQDLLHLLRGTLVLDLDGVPPLALPGRKSPRVIQWLGDYLRPESSSAAKRSTKPNPAAKPAIPNPPAPVSSSSGSANGPSSAQVGVPAWVLDHAVMPPTMPQQVSPKTPPQTPQAQSGSTVVIAPAATPSVSPTASLQASTGIAIPSLPAVPAMPVFFQHNPARTRVVSYSSLILLIALVTFGVTGGSGAPVLAAGLAVIVQVVDLLFLLIQFWRDPATQARDQLEQYVIRSHRRMRGLAYEASQQRRKHDKLSQRHDKRVAEVDAKQTHLQDEEQRRLQALVDAHRTRTTPLLQKQQLLQHKQADALLQLQQTLGAQLRTTRQQLAHLQQAERDEAAKQLKARQSQFVQQALQKFGLADANLPGVDALQRMKLVVAGITSAADINPQANAIRNMDATKRSAVLAWRQSLEQHAQLVAPKVLSTKESDQIRQRYAQQRQTLERDRDRLEAALHKQEQEIRAQAASKLPKIEAELKSLNDKHDQAAQQIRAETADALRGLNEQLSDPQRGTLPQLQALTAQLGATEQALEQVRTEYETVSKQLNAVYGQVQFGTYVLWVLGLKQKP